MSCAPTGCTDTHGLAPGKTTLAGVQVQDPRRPAGVWVAAGGSLLVGLLLIGLAAASLVAGHGGFSGGVGVALVIYGVAMVAGASALWQRSVFGRGPVVAMALLNLVAGYTFTASAPWVWVLVMVSAVTVVAAALPSTSRALRLSRVKPVDEPPPKDDPGT